MTYADYVSARLGSQGLVTVQPLLNDRDPLQGKLEIIKLVPNADPASPEYARLRVPCRLDDVARRRKGRSPPWKRRGTALVHVHGPIGRVILDGRGTHRDRRFRCARPRVAHGDGHGRHRQVALRPRRRDRRGHWQGPVADWRSVDAQARPVGRRRPGFHRVGPVDLWAAAEQRAVVPFSLTGQDSNGKQITTYGFLRVPAFDEMRLQAKPGLTPIEVAEEATETIDLRKVVDIGPRDTIEVRQDESFAVQRSNATCAPASATTVTYAAGREAPWRDTCSVAVRLVGQDTWSIVPVPIVILPKDPQAILSPASRTITPGQKDSVDILGDLLSWEGGRVGNTKTSRSRRLSAGQASRYRRLARPYRFKRRRPRGRGRARLSASQQAATGA